MIGYVIAWYLVGMFFSIIITIVDAKKFGYLDVSDVLATILMAILGPILIIAGSDYFNWTIWRKK